MPQKARTQVLRGVGLGEEALLPWGVPVMALSPASLQGHPVEPSHGSSQPCWGVLLKKQLGAGL